MITIKDVGIYHDSGTNPINVSEFHFSQLYNNNFNIISQTVYKQESIDCFLKNQHLVKIAGYHVSFPAVDSWVERFDRIYSTVKHSYVFCSELHQVTIDQLNYVDRPRVTICLAGKLNYNLQHAKLINWMDWFVTSTYFYRAKNPDLLASKLNYLANKDKFFDILLGCKRLHRDFVYNYITENSLKSKVLMTYHQRWSQDLRLSTEYITEDEGVEYNDPPNHTVQQVKYYGYNMTMSQVVPLKIYNQTYFSLVSETNAVNLFNFYTEKIVKPILAKRLFIVIAGQNYLKNLQSFGFQTFSQIIDESYDQEPNNELRWKMALDQLQYLCDQDPTKILNNIKEIVEFNHNLMLKQDWYNNFIHELKQDVVGVIDC